MIQHNDSHYPDDDLAMTKLPAEFHLLMTGLEQLFKAMDKPVVTGVHPDDMLHGPAAQ